jgi:putative Mn2+ efflux pump MntP
MNRTDRYSILHEALGGIKEKVGVFGLLAGQSGKWYHFQPMGQIATVLLFAFMAGADNFQVACGLGMLPLGRAKKWKLGASFGICEAVMSLVGLWAGAFLRTHVFGAATLAGSIALLVSGLLVVYLALNDRDLDDAANSGWLIFGLPLSLSLDNLVAGAGLGANGYAVLLCVVIIGLICTAMSLTGLFLGNRVRRLLPRSAGALAGAWLVLVAARSLVK